MGKGIRSRWVRFLVIPLLTLIGLYALFVTFQFSLIADIREGLSEVNEEDALAYGEVLFNTRSCNGCHAIIPGKRHLGPNLFGISERASEAYIRESILLPNAVTLEGYKAGTMPEYGDILDEDQVDALVIYLSSLK